MREVRHDTGRPPILQPDQKIEVIACITRQFQDSSPLFPKQVRRLASEMFRKEVSFSWTWRLVSRYPGVLQWASAYLQEDN
jgi:hypothetical protein